MIHDYTIEYKNVRLRPLAEGDIEALRNWRNNANNTRFLSRIPYITPKMQAAWYEQYQHNRDELCFAIDKTDDLKRIVGSLSLYDFNEDTCLYGKILIGEEKAHGKHVGVNATIAALRIAFEQLGMESVDLYVFTENEIAVKVYTEAGFRVTDVHKNDDGREEYTMTVNRKDFAYEYH